MQDHAQLGEISSQLGRSPKPDLFMSIQLEYHANVDLVLHLALTFLKFCKHFHYFQKIRCSTFGILKMKIFPIPFHSFWALYVIMYQIMVVLWCPYWGGIHTHFLSWQVFLPIKSGIFREHFTQHAKSQLLCRKKNFYKNTKLPIKSRYPARAFFLSITAGQ